MCIMEVRPGQHDSTIQQACTHNLATIRGDLELFTEILRARKAPQVLRDRVERFRGELGLLLADATDLYGDFLTAEFEAGHIHTHDTVVAGAERTSISTLAAEAAEIDAHRARKYETR